MPNKQRQGISKSNYSSKKLGAVPHSNHAHSSKKLGAVHAHSSKKLGTVPDIPNQSFRQLLQRAGMKPSKKLGQNFLIDSQIHQRIVEIAQLQPNEIALEIGPGLGQMTKIMLSKTPHVVAVEIDRQLCEWLTKELNCYPHFQLLHLDALENKHTLNPILVEKINQFPTTTSYKLIANLPYNIASPLIIAFLELSCMPNQLVVMVQREVAQRIVAKPGTADYGLLTLMVQLHGKATTIFDLPPHAFYPPPKVHSTVIQIIPHPISATIHNIKLLKILLHNLFQFRRKTIGSALRHFTCCEIPSSSSWANICETVLAQSKISPQQRAETLDLEAFIILSNCLNQLILPPTKF